MVVNAYFMLRPTKALLFGVRLLEINSFRTFDCGGNGVVFAIGNRMSVSSWVRLFIHFFFLMDILQFSSLTLSCFSISVELLAQAV